MFDEVFPGLAKSQSYHFQLVPVFLLIVGANSQTPAQGTTFRFSIHKGHHKFDQNRHPIQANFSQREGLPTMLVSACKLNFYVPNYVKIRKQEFVLKLAQRECNQEFEIGEYLIDVSTYIEDFKMTKTNRFCLRTFFSEDYELDFEIYLEQSRAALESIVKQAEKQRNSELFKENRTNYFKQTQNRSRSSSQAKSAKSAKRDNNKVFKDPQPSKLDVPTKNEETKQNLFKMFSDGDQSEKNEFTKTGDKVPLIHTKFKQLAKSDTPAEIVMSQSERLSQILVGEGTECESDEGNNRKVFLMWVYITLMLFAIYALMHPFKTV